MTSERLRSDFSVALPSAEDPLSGAVFFGDGALAGTFGETDYAHPCQPVLGALRVPSKVHYCKISELGALYPFEPLPPGGAEIDISLDSESGAARSAVVHRHGQPPLWIELPASRDAEAEANAILALFDARMTLLPA